ncbi:MAG: HlyC/CorC family transporter, partial [Sphingobacteriaceae bacterium]|nr:HlyC/CorC family transporter [Cytophagaceae bacterium]
AKQGVITGSIIAQFIKKPSRFIGTMLIGNTLALVLYGIFMEGYLHREFELMLQSLPPAFQFLNNQVIELLIPALIATILVLAVAEFVPKSLFLINPDVFLEVLAIPIWLIYYAMSPLVWAIVNLSRWFLVNVLRLDYSETKPVFGLTDLNEYLQNLNKTDFGKSKEDNADVDTKIFNNALEFREVRVGDCLIPRTEIVAVDIEDGLEALKKAFVDSGHSRVLVYRESIEDVLGYCHSLALFKKPKELKSIITPIPIVPEAMPAQDLLVKFTQERKSMALVVDEFGGTSGLVALEDLVEQIFGEIQDEYDTHEDWEEQKIDDRNYLLSARHEIEYLNEKYGWHLPEGDYDTLGGMIIAINEDIPRVNEVVIYEPFTFTILAMKDARIETVKVSISRRTLEG